jgi:uncharacterized membrane protein
MCPIGIPGYTAPINYSYYGPNANSFPFGYMMPGGYPRNMFSDVFSLNPFLVAGVILGLLLLAGVIFFMSRKLNSGQQQSQNLAIQNHALPLELLKLRLARGEISIEEYKNTITVLNK